jgi:hypothetical protein
MDDGHARRHGRLHRLHRGRLTEASSARAGAAGLTDVEIRETHRVHAQAASAIVRARKPAAERRAMATALFVCRQNAGRSQMSAALFEQAAGGRHQRAVGWHHAGRPRASRGRGGSCASWASTSPTASQRRLTHELAEQADVVVTMAAATSAPTFRQAQRRLGARGPRGPPRRRGPRHPRDDIARRVDALVAALDAPGQ